MAAEMSAYPRSASSETMPLGIEPSKTECPFCGLVWQDHTLRETDGCMAILHMQIFAAKVGDARLKGKPFPNPPAEVCPVCNKLTSEHSDDDVSSCMAKWRKRERGSTGLELQRSFLEGNFANEEPDPLKRAQLHARIMQRICSCGKAYGDHSVDEIRACAERPKPR